MKDTRHLYRSSGDQRLGESRRIFRDCRPLQVDETGHGVEPYTYLHDVLTRLPSMTNRQIKDIVPKAWPAATAKTRFRVA